MSSAISLAVSACTSPRNALGTNSSPCYLALPVAEDAVHSRGHFGGVRLMTAKELSTRTHLLDTLKAHGESAVKDLCVVEYRGSYRFDQVEKPIGKEPPGGVGRYAIVIVSRASNKLVGTLVRKSPPVRFRHVAMGLNR